MSLPHLVSMAAALWWGVAVLLLLASLLGALLFPRLPWQAPGTAPLRPVTAILPVKYWDADFVRNQESLFAQDYPELEIIATAAEAHSAALESVADIRQRFSHVASRVLQSAAGHAASPKLNNLWPGVDAARHDLILTKDSNIRLAPGDLENLVQHHGPGIGLVSTIPIVSEPQGFAAWIEASIINPYHGRALMLASALGMGVCCGKIMLFSRAALDEAGGLEGLSWAVGEDEALQQAFARIGLRTVFSDRTSRQILGRRTFHDVWQRQLRWALIWRLQAPAIFLADFLTSALTVSVVAMLAAPLIGLSPWTAMAATLGLWFAAESLLCLVKGWPMSLWSLPAFLAREILSLAVRLKALTTRQIVWGGHHIRVNAKAAR